jgi:shikimate dehydrogenase
MQSSARHRVLLGLLGSPIGHSASPLLHEAAGAAAGMQCYYHLIDVAGADESMLRTILNGVRSIGFAGINVTFPYKEAVLPLVDAVSAQVERIGAINAIVVQDGKLVGHNTDMTGFKAGFLRVLGKDLVGPVVLVGAGGVGKAIAFAMLELGVPAIRILERDSAKAEGLRAVLAPFVTVQIADSAEQALRGATGLINATPIGMLPNVESPVPVTLLRDDLWVADAVYLPLHTPLLKAAALQGARIMTGGELVIDQAIHAFQLFTGKEADRAIMEQAFEQVMMAQDVPDTPH